MLTAEAKKRNLESYETYVATYCGGEKVAEVPEREEPQNEVAAGRRDRVSEAEAGGIPVLLRDPESKAARAYQALADEVLDRLRFEDDHNGRNRRGFRDPF